MKSSRIIPAIIIILVFLALILDATALKYVPFRTVTVAPASRQQQNDNKNAESGDPGESLLKAQNELDSLLGPNVQHVERSDIATTTSKPGVVHGREINKELNLRGREFEFWVDLETGIDRYRDSCVPTGPGNSCRSLVYITKGNVYGGNRLALYTDPSEQSAKWLFQCGELGEGTSLFIPRYNPYQYFMDLSSDYPDPRTITLEGETLYNNKKAYAIKVSDAKGWPVTPYFELVMYDAETFLPLIRYFYHGGDLNKTEFDLKIEPRESFPSDLFDMRVPAGYTLYDPCTGKILPSNTPAPNK